VDRDRFVSEWDRSGFVVVEQIDPMPWIWIAVVATPWSLVACNTFLLNKKNKIVKIVRAEFMQHLLCQDQGFKKNCGGFWLMP